MSRTNLIRSRSAQWGSNDGVRQVARSSRVLGMTAVGVLGVRVLGIAAWGSSGGKTSGSKSSASGSPAASKSSSGHPTFAYLQTDGSIS